MTAPVPAGARPLAIYFYPEATLHVFALKRNFYVRDHNGHYPAFAEGGVLAGTRWPHPDEGTEAMQWDMEVLGLFYGYAMPETGWSGDC